jgi:hypothetical protein
VQYWEVKTDPETGFPIVNFLSSSGVQNKSVNCVRMSPLGRHRLAVFGLFEESVDEGAGLCR